MRNIAFQRWQRKTEFPNPWRDGKKSKIITKTQKTHIQQTENNFLHKFIPEERKKNRRQGILVGVNDHQGKSFPFFFLTLLRTLSNVGKV